MIIVTAEGIVFDLKDLCSNSWEWCVYSHILNVDFLTMICDQILTEEVIVVVVSRPVI